MAKGKPFGPSLFGGMAIAPQTDYGSGMALLDTRLVEKPWGRTVLPAPFAGQGEGRRIGEIWFPAPAGTEMALLTKYLFTSERLSIQVHPNDAQAQSRGLPAGKEECWYILDAEPDAVLGMGTVMPLDQAALREAALDGAIEDLMAWHPVTPGMLFHIEPGTVHAIGPGIALVEVQQNVDITYRLYDYGRPRELHLDDGVAVSVAQPFPATSIQHVDPAESRILLRTPHFTLAHICADANTLLSEASGEISLIPIEGTAQADGIPMVAGQCAVTADAAAIRIHGRALVAWA